MPAITIKNIPPSLYERIKKNAALNYRSINNEIIYRLQRSLAPSATDPDELLSRIEQLHSVISIPPLTEELLEQARHQGRP